MHILSDRLRSEFLAVPQLVRFTMANGSNGLEPTLLIKSSTLTLKYLLRLRCFKLLIIELDKGCIAYGIQIADDPDSPAVLWSVVEHQEELETFRALTVQTTCVVFLFNELAVSVAWSNATIEITDEKLRMLFESTDLSTTVNTDRGSEMTQCFKAIGSGDAVSKTFIHENIQILAWTELRSTYITNRASKSVVSVFETNEGGQQEEMALWLIDNLRPSGAAKSPQVHFEKYSRELSDLVLSYEFGAFLFESKALSILSRETLPNRSKLSAKVKNHISKATNQLIGGLKSVRLGQKITTIDGRELEIERNAPAHAIIIVPDLTLLSNAAEFGGTFLIEFLKRTKAFLHILDPAELLRMVQAAEILEQHGKTVTRLMCFDSHLVERFNRAIKLETPDFDFLLRIG